MQISIGEVEKVLQGSGLPGACGRKQVSTPEQLAESYGVNPREVEQQVIYARAAEEDPWRERRVRELKARVEAGAYYIDAETIIDMAERRAIADRASGG